MAIPTLAQKGAKGTQKVVEPPKRLACFIGGIAVQRWGEPRFTADADLTLLTGVGGEEKFIDPLLSHFRPRRSDARTAFAWHQKHELNSDADASSTRGRNEGAAETRDPFADSWRPCSR